MYLESKSQNFEALSRDLRLHVGSNQTAGGEPHPP